MTLYLSAPQNLLYFSLLPPCVFDKTKKLLHINGNHPATHCLIYILLLQRLHI